MRKNISILLVILMLAGIFTGCGKGPAGKNEKLSVVTTIFPEYDWVMNTLGDKASGADVTMLLTAVLTCTASSLPQMTLSRFPAVTSLSMSAANPTSGWRMH